MAFDPWRFVFSRRPTSTLHPMIVTTKTTWTQYPGSSPQSSRDARHPPSGKMDVSHPPSGSLRVARQLPPGTVGLPGHGAWKSFSGNGDFLAGDSPASALTVSVIASSFPAESVLTASVRSSANGKPVTLTDTVKPRGAVRGTPAGPVIFMNGGQVLPTVALKGGMAVWKTTSLRVGSDRIQAVYAGAGSFESSASAILVERIVAARRTMALKTAVESANPRWRVPEQAK